MASTTIVMNFSICQSANCKTLTFNDLTGAYNATTNPTGYKTADIDDADRVTTLTITQPDGTITVFTLPLADFITTNTELDYTINAASLGLTAGSKLPDGLYTIKYKVVFGNGYSKFVTKTILLSCQIRCCIEGLFDDIATSQSLCDSNTINNALFAFSLLKSMQFEGECNSDKTKINSMLESLQAICDDTCPDCGCL